MYFGKKRGTQNKKHTHTIPANLVFKQNLLRLVQ
jgi:hypothetical protein